MSASFRAAATVTLLATFILLSCAQASPEIRATSVKVLRVQSPSGAFAERLSVFLYFHDADGTEDFSSITIQHEQTGLVWVLDSQDAEVRIRGRDRWTGSSIFAPPPGGFFPEGGYIVTVTDLAGNEAIRPITLSTDSFPATAPMRFSLSGDVWTLERNAAAGPFTENYLFLYDRELRLVHVWKMPENEKKVVGDLETFRQQYRDAVTIQAYCETRDGQAGVLLSPVQME